MNYNSKFFDEKDVNTLTKNLEEQNNEFVKISLKIIEDSFKLVNYNLDKICLSFNGGKDCTVVLHLIKFYILKNIALFENNKDFLLKTLYVCPKDEFEEVHKFIESSEKYYCLNLFKYDSDNIKNSLIEFKKSSLGENVQLIFMGQRSSDKKKNLLKPIQNTDLDWPKFTLSNPVYNWSYKQVWKFILKNQVPYCVLYDNGYSSLGSKKNTIPNLKLIVKRENGNIDYLPAFKLEDENYERSNRNRQ